LLFAGRYRLQAPLLPQSPGSIRQQHWRGLDETLARPVLVAVIEGSGPDAADLLSAAVANGRVAHPGIASVFDAAHVDGCTYVVSEWVDGPTLRSLVARDGPLETGEAAAVSRSAGEAVAELHRNGLTHGNLHPSNVRITEDGGVKLTELHTDGGADQAADVRCLGALLYLSLTGRWPARPAGGPLTDIPAAPEDDRRPCTPRQVRAGVPGSLSALAMRALYPEQSGLSAVGFAEALNGHAEEPMTGPLPLVEEIAEEPRPSRLRRLGIPILVLALIALAGLVLGIWLGAFPVPTGGYQPFGGNDRVKASPSAATVVETPLQVAQASIVDPQGDGTELAHADRVIDGKPDTAWRTDDYKSAKFGGLKTGMGVLLDLGDTKTVHKVTIEFQEAGAAVELRYSDSQSSSPDGYHTAATQPNAPATVTFTLTKPIPARYLLIWLTTLPPHNGQYGAGVAEVHVS